MVRNVEDVVIGLAVAEIQQKVLMELTLEPDHQLPSSLAERDTAVEQLVPTEHVQGSEELPRVIVQHLVSLLELVQFFQDRHRNNDVVLLELKQAGAVVKNNVGVKNEQFSC